MSAKKESRRALAIAKATAVRDALLTAQATIPGLVAELDDFLEMLDPPPAEKEKKG